MIETKGVCHFTIAVKDTLVSTKFYTEVLGLRLLNANHERGMIFLDSGGDCVVLMRTETSIAPTLQRDVHHAFHIESDKFEQSLGYLEAEGIQIILVDERLENSVVTGRSIYFPDPDGNVLELVDMYSYSGERDETISD